MCHLKVYHFLSIYTKERFMKSCLIEIELRSAQKKPETEIPDFDYIYVVLFINAVSEKIVMYMIVIVAPGGVPK